MKCRRCRDDAMAKPEWKCAFDNSQKVFDTANHNCGTINAIRNLCHDNDRHGGVAYFEDHTFYCLPFELPEPSEYFGAIYLIGYKQRGRIESACVLLNEGRDARPLFLDLAESAIEEVVNYRQRVEVMNKRLRGDKE